MYVTNKQCYIDSNFALEFLYYKFLQNFCSFEPLGEYIVMCSHIFKSLIRLPTVKSRRKKSELADVILFARKAFALLVEEAVISKMKDIDIAITLATAFLISYLYDGLTDELANKINLVQSTPQIKFVLKYIIGLRCCFFIFRLISFS